MTRYQDQIGDFVASVDHDWSKPAERQVLLALVDTLAVALAARNEAVLHHTLNYAYNLGEGVIAPAWVDARGFSPETAALVNGVAAHALDYDDVAPNWRGHASAVLFPALLALPEMQHRSGDDLIDAYAVGFEIGARIGRACAEVQYRAGWHTTATIGVIAAAVACCRALRLDARTASSAIGLAIAQAAGSQANFGSMAKPLQAGFAAAAAVRAVRLAAAGIGASPTALEGSGGFATLYGGADLATVLQGLGATDPILTRNAIERKSLPICYAAYRAVEAVRILKDAHDIDAANVRAVEIESSAGSHKALLSRPPTDGTEAKFSLEYAVALQLIDGVILLNSFIETSFGRRDIRDVMDRVSVTEIQGPSAPRRSRVRIALRDGRVHEHAVETLSPHNNDTQLLGKIADCLAFGGWDDFSGDLYETVVALPGRPVATLLKALASLNASPAKSPRQPVAEIAL